jgi:hypothetical protein
LDEEDEYAEKKIGQYCETCWALGQSILEQGYCFEPGCNIPEMWADYRKENCMA